MNGLIRTTIQFAIPKEKDMHDILEKVDAGCRHEAESKEIISTVNSWAPTTIASAYMKNAVKLLNLKMDDSLEDTANIFDLIEITAKVRSNKDAEKEGNINIKYHPGASIVRISKEADDLNDIVKMLLNEDKFLESLNIPTNDLSGQAFDDRQFLATLDKATKKELYEVNGIIVSADWSSTIISYIYIKHIFIELIKELNENGTASINFFDIIEFHAIMKNDVLEIRLRPGYDSKLLIKSDDSTERTDD